MLTYSDIELLIKAIEAWEQQVASNAMSTSLMGAMLLGDSDSRAEEFMDKTISKAAIETENRKRTATLLKAKLYGMQEQLSADQLFSHVVVKGEK
jgi:hypothetical protein